LPVFFDV